MEKKNDSQKQGLRTFFVIIGMCAWATASIIAVEFLMSLLMTAILGEQLATPMWSAVYSAVVYALALILIIFVPPRVMAKWKIGKKSGEFSPKKSTREDLGLRGEPTWMDIGLSPIAYIVSTLFAAGMVALFSNFSWFNAGEAQSTGFGLYMSAPERLVAFITLVVIAPVAEEIIFRGWLYDKIRTRLGGKMPEWAGVLVSTLVVSVMFGVVHLQWNVGVNVFALSVVLCLLREVTGTIYAGIFTHMIKNAVAFYLLYIMGFGA